MLKSLQIMLGRQCHHHHNRHSLMNLLDHKRVFPLTRSLSLFQDMYNFLDGSLDDSASANAPTGSSPSTVQAMTRYSRHLSGKASDDSNTISGIMNGVIKEKLEIIPKNLVYVSLAPR